MKKAIFTVLFSLSLTGAASAQDAPPPPCGPKGDLPPALSTNVASDSRCFEIRMYTANTMRNGGGDIDGNTVKSRALFFSPPDSV